MLTRLNVDGFKNLVGVDVSFGPFTCVAGPNSVGKSNLFDAITFLSALASRPLLEAALSVRTAQEPGADVRSIFHGASAARPPLHRLEKLPNPKNTLHSLLRTASGLPRRRRFSQYERIHRIADLIEDFSPLRSLSAFRALEQDLAMVLAERSWQ